jgi:hypothetical protein
VGGLRHVRRKPVLIVLAVAAGAALCVLVYNHVHERDPELADAAIRRVHQLAAVVVVITSGVEKAFEALQSGSRSKPLYASKSYTARPSWDDGDEFDPDSP